MRGFKWAFIAGMLFVVAAGFAIFAFASKYGVSGTDGSPEYLAALMQGRADEAQARADEAEANAAPKVEREYWRGMVDYADAETDSYVRRSQADARAFNATVDGTVYLERQRAGIGLWSVWTMIAGLVIVPVSLLFGYIRVVTGVWPFEVELRKVWGK